MIRICGGEFKGRRLKTASGPGYRPATEKVREAVFSMLDSRISQWSELVAADFFAGSGSLGFEALSRGARRVHFVEKSGPAVKQIRENAGILGLSPQRCKVSKTDAFRFLRSSPLQGIGLAFVDPPYKMGLLIPFMDLLLTSGWMDPAGLILAEVEGDLAISPERFPGLEPLVQKTYGQTRIYLWMINAER